MRVVYTVLDGRLSGGQVICGHLMSAALSAGHQVCLITPSLGEFTDQLQSRAIEVIQIPMERTFFSIVQLLLQSFFVIGRQI